MSRPIILTGLRANNDLHIGNYFGALLPLIDMAQTQADNYDVHLFMPDLHSFTTPIDHTKLAVQIRQTLRTFVAAGLPLDNDHIRLYRQSYVPAHSELTIILNSFTGFGEMSRMTQFKDKSAKLSDDRISVGLFDYPVLMAADILLYGAQYIPVGDDQSQHLEFTRDIATRFNNRFGEIFVVPEPVTKQHEFFGTEQGLRIKDLADPLKKMSKSDDSDKGIIFLHDDPAQAAKKILSATTDSVGVIHYDVAQQPGISNLLQLLALLTNQPLVTVITDWEGKTSYGELKSRVAQAVQGFLNTFQSTYETTDSVDIDAKLTKDESYINTVANARLSQVQTAVGLRS
jgi:tryptophanyl-tRNA synthetase